MTDVVDRAAALQAYGDETAGCTRCALAGARTQVVFGSGNPDADLMFVGEAPGFHEDQQGRPFVGAAGQLLAELLAGIGLDRSKVFITNVVRHRPPGNRDPLPDEVAACDVWLRRHLDALQPRVLVTLGRHAMGKFFPGESISRIHGKPRVVGGVTVFPMFHPAAALRQPSLRPSLMADFTALAIFLATTPAVADEPAPPADQMTLFGR